LWKNLGKLAAVGVYAGRWQTLTLQSLCHSFNARTNAFDNPVQVKHVENRRIAWYGRMYGSTGFSKSQFSGKPPTL